MIKIVITLPMRSWRFDCGCETNGREDQREVQRRDRRPEERETTRGVATNEVMAVLLWLREKTRGVVARGMGEKTGREDQREVS